MHIQNKAHTNHETPTMRYDPEKPVHASASSVHSSIFFPEKEIQSTLAPFNFT